METVIVHYHTHPETAHTAVHLTPGNPTAQGAVTTRWTIPAHHAATVTVETVEPTCMSSAGTPVTITRKFYAG